MCGYVGFTNNLKSGEDKAVLKNMMDSIKHRGPDSEGMYVGEDMCLGFRRLSIIDLSEGSQPLYNEDNNLVLTFNGEIYNFPEIREELVNKGHIFKTHTDSEVILHGFEEYGEDIVPKLRGMFSFVIWNKETKTLFGARDRFGIKPFYYANMGDTFMFGSEIKAFLHHPDFEKKLNKNQLEHYLSFQYSPLETTFFENVFKLLPAHYFTFKNGKMEITRYWRPNFNADEDKSFEEYAEIIDKAINESVEAHKISDVEVGSFLSGGIDSSYIASAAKVDKTFTVGFGEGGHYSEIDFAKEFSATINTKNESKVITSEEFFEAFPLMQYHMDEPLADPASIALYFVAKLASEHVKVVLSGEGADELFGGYRIYEEPITCTGYNKIPMPIRRLIGAVASIFPQKRGFNFLVRRGKTLEERYIGNANMFTKKERAKILKGGSKAEAPNELCKKFYAEAEGYDDITKMQYLDINMWLMGDILLKADKTSMANSLELRVPFLDKEVMNLAEKIPTKYRVSTTNTKLALRAAADKTIPSSTASRQKLGFPVPIRVWLKEDRYYNKVKAMFESKAANEFFHTKLLVKMLDDHKKGKADLSRRIWTVYTFLVWYDEFFIKR